MNKRQARIEALRSIAGIAESSPGAGYDPTGNDDDNEKVFAEMRIIYDELMRRADQIEKRMQRGPIFKNGRLVEPD